MALNIIKDSDREEVTARTVYKNLAAYVFSEDEETRDEILEMNFDNLKPIRANSEFEYEVNLSNNVLWNNADAFVDESVLFMVLYAYTEQLKDEDVSYFFWDLFQRVKEADAIAEHFDRETFMSCLKKLPYDEDVKWFVPIFRYGDDETISLFTSYLTAEGNRYCDEFILRLLELSDTNQAIVLRDKISYEYQYRKECKEEKDEPDCCFATELYAYCDEYDYEP